MTLESIIVFWGCNFSSPVFMLYESDYLNEI